MSATILDVNTFCRNVGLDLKAVKFTNVDSDPIQNRPISQTNTAYLNYATLRCHYFRFVFFDNINQIFQRFVDEDGTFKTAEELQKL